MRELGYTFPREEPRKPVDFRHKAAICPQIPALFQIGTLVLPLLSLPSEGRVAMSTDHSASLCWCQVPVPQELETELLCVQHFLLGIDHDCAELRRETAMGKTNSTRQSEIATYVQTTAMKLTQVATGRMRLSDEYKKRILTTFLTLMNLQESLERAANRTPTFRELRTVVVPG